MDLINMTNETRIHDFIRRLKGKNYLVYQEQGSYLRVGRRVMKPQAHFIIHALCKIFPNLYILFRLKMLHPHLRKFISFYLFHFLHLLQ